MWVVRDCYSLWLFRNKPIRNKTIQGWYDPLHGSYIDLDEFDNTLFPKVKWEDEPIEVGLIQIYRRADEQFEGLIKAVENSYYGKLYND